MPGQITLVAQTIFLFLALWFYSDIPSHRIVPSTFHSIAGLYGVQTYTPIMALLLGWAGWHWMTCSNGPIKHADTGKPLLAAASFEI